MLRCSRFETFLPMLLPSWLEATLLEKSKYFVYHGIQPEKLAELQCLWWIRLISWTTWWMGEVKILVLAIDQKDFDWISYLVKTFPIKPLQPDLFANDKSPLWVFISYAIYHGWSGLLKSFSSSSCRMKFLWSRNLSVAKQNVRISAWIFVTYMNKKFRIGDTVCCFYSFLFSPSGKILFL